MDSEDFIPRLLLFGGLTAALVIYTRRRGRQMRRVAGDATAAAVASASNASGEAGSLVERGQGMLEAVLDDVADRALKELKGVLKEGLQRLEEAVEKL